MIGKAALPRTGFALFAAAALLIAAEPAYSQPLELLMVNEVWAPYRIGDNLSPEAWTGIDIDLARELERRMGVTITLRYAPWARCLEMIRLGQADILTGVAWTEERSRSMRFVPTSYSSVRPAFYAASGRERIFLSYEGLRSLRIGQSTNSAYFEPYNSDGNLNKISLKDEETILRMLEAGRIDVAVGTEPNLAWDTARFGFKGRLVRTEWQPEGETGLYVVIPNRSGNPGLAERIDRCIREMLADGTLEAIHGKYR